MKGQRVKDISNCHSLVLKLVGCEKTVSLKKAEEVL